MTTIHYLCSVGGNTDTGCVSVHRRVDSVACVFKKKHIKHQRKDTTIFFNILTLIICLYGVFVVT